MDTRIRLNIILSPSCLCRYMVSAAFLMVMLWGNTYAQKEDKIRTILKESDLKKIEKTDEGTGVADQLMEEATRLNKDIIAAKDNPGLDDKAKKKKVRQLEGQARQRITSASELYQERNGIKYRMYKTYIEKFWLQFEGDEITYDKAKSIEEQSNDDYFKAVTNRTEASKMPVGYEKIQKLNQALEFENMALEKQMTVLGIYYNIDLTDQERAAETIQPVVPQTSVSRPVEQEAPIVAPQPVIPVQIPVEEQQPAATAEIKTEPPVADISSGQQPQTQQIQPAEKQVISIENESKPSQPPSEVVFRIQLAASRTRLTKDKVAQICSKPYSVDMAEENGWYKYYIAAGNSYVNAKKTLRECGVEKAFIIPYKDGRRITIAEATSTNP